jgi:hypothetical protein
MSTLAAGLRWRERERERERAMRLHYAEHHRRNGGEVAATESREREEGRGKRGWQGRGVRE